MASAGEPRSTGAVGDPGTQRIRVRRARDASLVEGDDEIAVEEPLEIRVGRSDERGTPPRSLSVTMRTPGHDIELAVGFLYTEGLLRGREEIASVGYARSHLRGPPENVVDVILERDAPFDPAAFERHFYVNSSCGVCGKASLDAVRVLGVRPLSPDHPRVAADIVSSLPRRLRAGQPLFAATGGLHAAGLFDPSGRRRSVREDVGRHNAVDKLIGEQVLAGRGPLNDALLAVSGRASFEILQKAAVAGIPFVAAVGAPSSLAVALAQEYGMPLAGFVRDRGFNVYAGEGRILPTPLAGAGS